MDNISKEQRSRNMAAIRSKDNKTTELALVRQLRKERITGWRRHQGRAPGTPDFLFPKATVALFVDGCFWHGCERHFMMPKTNQGYWEPKIARNKARDRAVNARYKAKGWKVLRIWEHDIKRTPDRPIRRLKKLLARR